MRNSRLVHLALASVAVGAAVAYALRTRSQRSLTPRVGQDDLGDSFDPVFGDVIRIPPELLKQTAREPLR